MEGNFYASSEAFKLAYSGFRKLEGPQSPNCINLVSEMAKNSYLSADPITSYKLLERGHTLFSEIPEFKLTQDHKDAVAYLLYRWGYYHLDTDISTARAKVNEAKSLMRKENDFYSFLLLLDGLITKKQNIKADILGQVKSSTHQILELDTKSTNIKDEILLYADLYSTEEFPAEALEIIKCGLTYLDQIYYEKKLIDRIHLIRLEGEALVKQEKKVEALETFTRALNLVEKEKYQPKELLVQKAWCTLNINLLLNPSEYGI